MVNSISPEASMTKSFVRLSIEVKHESKVSSIALDLLPRDVIKHIADSFLSPKDRLRLSSCNRQLRSCLPKALTIEIANRDGSQRLKQRFFVTPYKAENFLHVDQKECYCQADMLYSHQTLHYGEEYVFWDFDYPTDSPVYFGRHSRLDYRSAVSFLTEGLDTCLQCFTVALRQGMPMQTWQVVGKSSFVSPGDAVVWSDVVGLAVRGKNPIQECHQDSMEHSILDCFDYNPAYPNLWMALRSSTKWKDEFEELCEAHEWGSLRLCTPTHCHTEPTNPNKVTVQSLVMAATPAVCQSGHTFLYAPGQDIGETHAVGNNVVVQFHFWIDCGIMYFWATNLLFSIAIPILKENGVDYAGLKGSFLGVHAMQVLLDIKSGRWLIITRYMEVAADGLDVEEYCPDKDAMMREFREYRRDYSVEYREPSQAIHVDVKGGVVCTQLDDGSTTSTCGEELPTWNFVMTREIE